MLLDENDPEAICVTPDGRVSAEFGRLLIDSGASEHGWSKAELAIRCPRAYALRYLATDEERGCPSPPPAAPLGRGILVHCGLAHFYESVRWQQHGRSEAAFRAVYYAPGEAMRVRARRLVDIEGCAEKEVAQWLALAQAACRVYFAKYGVDNWEIVAVEKLWVVEPSVFQEVTGVVAATPFTTRLDLLYRDSRGKMRITDHKSTAAGLSAKRYTLAGGVLSKEWLGYRNYGAEFGGVVINMIAWRGVKTTFNAEGCAVVPDAEAATITCQRFSLDPAPFAVARWAHDYVEHTQRLVQLGIKTIRNDDGTIKRVDTRSPWEYPGAVSEQVCESKYGTCEFWDMCRWGPPVSK